MEHFLVEPKFNGLVDGNPSLGTFSFQRCFNIEGLSAVEYGYTKTNCDTLASNLIHGEQSENELFVRKLDGATDWSFDGTDTSSDIWHEYLLDADYIPSKESYIDNVDPKHHPVGSCEPTDGDEKVELLTANIPMLEEAIADQSSSFLDKMTFEELRNTFSNIFGRETAVMDQQWLKQRILFGLKNLDVFTNGFKVTEISATLKSNNVEGTMVLSTSDECTGREQNPLNDIFKFKTKPRFRNVKRGKHVNYDYLKSFSSEVSKVVFGSTELSKKRVLVSGKRPCRLTQRYVEDSLEHNSKHRRQRYRSYETVSESKVLCKGPNMAQNSQKKPGSTVFLFGKETFRGGIQVPLDLSVVQEHPKNMSQESEIGDSRVHSYAGSDIDLYSSESEDGISEGDCVSSTTKQGKTRRKKHISWSLPEVLKLVDGVSKFGVGKWTEMKKLLFPLYEHRTAVDLKDKWRNLLRASSQGLHAKKGDPIRNNSSHATPQHVLRHVRELAVLYPYPRPRVRKGYVSQNRV